MKFSLSKDGPGRGCECNKRWIPRPPQEGLALTKQLSMEQETRAVRLMVTGSLGQRTCPRSRCAARQPRAPAASRLRDPPGAAAARSSRAGGGTPARLPRASPLLSTMERAQLRPPARAQKGGERGESPRRAGKAEAGLDGSRSPARHRGSSLSAVPGPCGQATPETSRGILKFALRDRPKNAQKGRQDCPRLSFPIFPGKPPHAPLLTQNSLRSSPSSRNNCSGA